MNFKRLIVAAILLPILFSYIYFLSSLYFLFLLLVVCILAMLEFFRMYKVQNRLAVPGIFLGALLFYIVCLNPEYFPEAIFLSLFVLLLIRLLIARSPSGCISDIGTIGVGFFYIAGFLSFHWDLREEADGVKYIIFLYSVVWLSDSAAFYIGTYLGRKKLFPSVSPNKTFEGAFGSIISGGIAALIMQYILQMAGFSLVSSAGTGLLIGTVVIMGDLIESMFKRDAGVKDSSSFIPGHGGILDKIDGLLVAGPVFYLILRFLK